MTNPLLLTLYIITFSSYSSVPEKRSFFYRRVFEVLYKEHDSASKVGFEREFKTKLHQEQFEEILRLFSIITFFENQYNFELTYLEEKFKFIKEKIKLVNKSLPDFHTTEFVDDLKVSIGIWTEDSGIYSFAHRSLQEYFAAVYVQNLRTNKENIYNKIIERAKGPINSSSSFSNLENFFDLCKEVDEYFFYRYLKLPIFKDILAKISDKSKHELVLNVLNICVPAVHIVAEGRIIGFYIQKSIYSYFFDPFHNLLMSALGNVKLSKKSTSEIIKICKRQNKHEHYFKLDFDNDHLKPGELRKISSIFNKYIVEISFDFSNYIASTLNELDSYFESTKMNEIDVSDFI